MQNRTPRHVPQGSCQARDDTRHPIPGLHTGLQASHRTFSQCSALSDGSVDSEDTPSPADTSSIRSYSLSPLKASRVKEISRLVLPGQFLLLRKVVIKIMDNSTNKLTAFCTASRLSQEVRQIIICLDVSNQ